MKLLTRSNLMIGAIAFLPFAAGIWLGFEKDQRPATIMIQDHVITVLPKPKDLQPFQLNTGTKEAFTLESLRNRYSILFFGYTSCPDVCPTTLHVLSRLHAKLEKNGASKDLQIVFVSVDPKRDRPEKLQKYVSYFDKKFVGVGGNAKEIAGFAGQLSASYEVLDNGKADDYGVNHTGLLFIINPKAQFAAILSPPHEVDLIESRLELLKQLEGKEGK